MSRAVRFVAIQSPTTSSKDSVAKSALRDPGTAVATLARGLNPTPSAVVLGSVNRASWSGVGTWMQ